MKVSHAWCDAKQQFCPPSGCDCVGPDPDEPEPVEPDWPESKPSEFNEAIESFCYWLLIPLVGGYGLGVLLCA